MGLYTIVFAYEGGTYLSQLNAGSPALAAKKWAKGIRIKRAGVEFYKVRSDFAKGMDDPDNAPTPLRGLKGAWCAGSLDGGLVNIVLTRRPSRPQPPDKPLDDEGRKDVLAMARIIADPKSDDDERAMALNTLKYILPG